MKMKNAWIALLAVGTLTVGCTSTHYPQTGSRTPDRYEERRDDNRESRLERRLERYEDELRLTNRQKRELRQISDRYERRGLTREERNNRDAYRRLQQQKRRELLSVLTPSQRERLRQLDGRDAGFRKRRG